MTAAHWFCQACEQKAIEAIKTDQIVEERCKKFLSETRDRLNKLEDMAVKWEKIEKQYAKIDSELQVLKQEMESSNPDDSTKNPDDRTQDLSSSVKSLVDECMEEERERDRRKNNIILHGIAETTSDDAQERSDGDLAQVSAILDFLNVTYEVRKVQRLGKRDENSKSRPLLIQLPNSTCSDELCRRANKLRQAPDSMKGVFIQPDRTQKQRAKRAELVKELKKRQDDGDSTWTIQNDKLVKKRTFQPKDKGSSEPGSFRGN